MKRDNEMKKFLKRLLDTKNKDNESLLQFTMSQSLYYKESVVLQQSIKKTDQRHQVSRRKLNTPIKTYGHFVMMIFLQE
jgi:hypothetical protein